MNEMQLLMELHRGNPRQGPGSDACTRLALELSGIDRSRALRVADIGCGTGAQTLALAEALQGRITAVDVFAEFLEELRLRQARRPLRAAVETLQASMDALPFEDGSFDLIWSEGAVYCMGFAEGVAAWKRFLKPGGILAVTEISWLTAERPDELERFWTAEYPQMGTVSEKIRILEASGLRPIAHFALPESCWTESYYGPLRRAHAGFLRRFPDHEAALAVVRRDEEEMALFDRFKDAYGYVFYIAQKIA